MKTRPILFSGEMVRAILDGRKTQTRRVIKPQPPRWEWSRQHKERLNLNVSMVDGSYWVRCPYGVSGDRLWVRETWATPGNYDHIKPSELSSTCFTKAELAYRATERHGDVYYKWRPSIFMPREFSRIALRITGVHVERVQDISNVDARAEGIIALRDERDLFAQLWDSINAKRGYGWDVNPWVWVVEFERMEGEA